MSAGIQEKNTSYLHTNTYVTLNELTDETTHIWLVFHGMGYLSKYFIHYFNGLDPQKHYVISPQAPSKYYQDSSFKRIGAKLVDSREYQARNNEYHELYRCYI